MIMLPTPENLAFRRDHYLWRVRGFPVWPGDHHGTI